MERQIPDWMSPVFEREEHPFYVWEELMKTPECLSSVLTESNRLLVRQAAEAVAGSNAVHLLGCGSSYFAGIAGAYLFNGAVGLPAYAYNAFEFSAYPPARLKGSAVIGISHTGGTAVVLDSLELAKRRGAAAVIGLTDVERSPLTLAATHVIEGGGGREKPLPKTRSFAVSLLKMYLLAAEVGRLSGDRLEEMQAILEQSPDMARQVLDGSERLTGQIAAGLNPSSSVYLFGAGPNTASVLDGALKLQEMAQARAHAFELEEGMHGPWVTMEPDDLVIVYAVRGPSFEKSKKLISALAPVGVNIWVLTDAPDSFAESGHHVTSLPDVPELIAPLFSVLPLYEFTYRLALARGIRPDAMRLTDERFLQTRLKLPR
ncbi:SIS domain-containing protein [Paenibacillus thalictri]|uniref:Glutamine--fructose-6-phosphate aminotransferase [isomerizing] n=1 Tax=Paenibacillus thalictri TaxID=2527873 RepID=A0A4Q9DEP8_9BACL|nr:SIS domain-containing protein [Paenibacillus thalictri]TBL70099.1 SIS domain-containing protein [Paenibacillus thalictri]